jgi:hypothetical protein
MQEYIDTRFTATEAVVAAELRVVRSEVSQARSESASELRAVRAEMAQARAEATTDHAEVKAAIEKLTGEVSTLKTNDTRDHARSEAWVQVAKMVVTGLTVLGVVVSVIVALVELI